MKKLGKIKDLLSREEMRQIQGGSGGSAGCIACTVNSDCASTVCVNWGGDCSGPCGCGKYCI